MTYGLGKTVQVTSTHLLLADVLIYWDAMKRFRRPSLCGMDPGTYTSCPNSVDVSMSVTQRSCMPWQALGTPPPTT